MSRDIHEMVGSSGRAPWGMDRTRGPMGSSFAEGLDSDLGEYQLQGLVNVPMFHITQRGYKFQQIFGLFWFGDVKQIPKFGDINPNLPTRELPSTQQFLDFHLSTG